MHDSINIVNKEKVKQKVQRTLKKLATYAVVLSLASPFAVMAQTLPGSGVTTGPNATAGDQSVASGYNSNAAATNASAYGFDSYAAQNSVAAGSMSSAYANYSVGVGNFVSVGGLYGIGIGNNAMVASTAQSSIAIGNNSFTTGINDISIGNTAGVIQSGGNNTSVGAGSGYTTTAGLQGTTNLGYDAGQGNTTSYATAIGANTQVTGTNSVALGSGSVSTRDNDVSVGTASSPRTISNVATATQGDEAVNLNQLNAALSGISVGGNPLAVSYDTSSFSKVTLQGLGGSIISNLAPGVAGTDAVNLNQLNAVQSSLQNEINSINTNTGSTGNTGTTTTSNTDPNAVHYNTGNSGDVTVNGNGQIHGVLAGTSANDAVNVAQLEANTEAAYQYTNTVAANTLNQANQYTNQAIAGVNSRIDNLSNRIDGVGAMSAAIGSNMFNPNDSHDTQVGIGLANYRGAFGYSVGVFRRISSNAYANLKISGATQAGGVAVGAGINVGF